MGVDVTVGDEEQKGWGNDEIHIVSSSSLFYSIKQLLDIDRLILKCHHSMEQRFVASNTDQAC